MQFEKIDEPLRNIAFKFFYWFSRFEFALKQNDYLKDKKAGQNAEPGWGKFIERWHEEYSASDEAKRLIDASPKRQVVTADGSLGWKCVEIQVRDNDLLKVIRVLKIVRNNLFHGGKHGVDGWDNVKRTEELLNLGNMVLNELAELAGIEVDFKRYY